MIGKIGLALFTLVLLCTAVGQAEPALTDTIAELVATEQNSPVENSELKLQANPNRLHRLDFRIEGKSCPACLLAIQNKIKSIKGVQDAVVMLRYPFSTSIIYQPKDASADYILTMIKVKEAHIKIVDIKDHKTNKINIQ